MERHFLSKLDSYCSKLELYREKVKRKDIQKKNKPFLTYAFSEKQILTQEEYVKHLMDFIQQSMISELSGRKTIEEAKHTIAMMQSIDENFEDISDKLALLLTTGMIFRPSEDIGAMLFFPAIVCLGFKIRFLLASGLSILSMERRNMVTEDISEKISNGGATIRECVKGYFESSSYPIRSDLATAKVDSMFPEEDFKKRAEQCKKVIETGLFEVLTKQPQTLSKEYMTNVSENNIEIQLISSHILSQVEVLIDDAKTARGLKTLMTIMTANIVALAMEAYIMRNLRF